MGVTNKQLPITSPCPITLDRSGISEADRKLFCAHCTKDVHLLSNLTEREARGLLRDRAGEDICISYAVGHDGGIRFQPEPQPRPVPRSVPRSAPTLVPVSALRRRTAPSRMSLAASVAAIGTAALLSACAPHRDERAETKTETVEQTEPYEHVAGGIEAEPLPQPETIVDGGIKAEPLPEPPTPEGVPEDLLIAAGGIRAEPLPTPEPIANHKPDTHVRGGMVARELDEPCDDPDSPSGPL